MMLRGILLLSGGFIFYFFFRQRFLISGREITSLRSFLVLDPRSNGIPKIRRPVGDHGQQYIGSGDFLPRGKGDSERRVSTSSQSLLIWAIADLSYLSVTSPSNPLGAKQRP